MTRRDPPPPTFERLAQALTELSEVQLELEEERRRRAEVESLFDTLLRAMSDAVVLIDARGRVVRVNDAAERLLGRSGATLLGCTARELFGQEAPSTPWELFERAPDGSLRSLETTIVSPQRGEVGVSLSVSVLRDASEKVLGAVYAARDLSDTQRLVRELAAAESRSRLLAEVGELMDREVKPEAALQRVCERLADAFGASVAIILVDDVVVEGVVCAPAGDFLASGLLSLVGQPVERRSALWTAAREGRAVHAAVVREDFPLLPVASPGVRSAAVVPLTAGDDVLGAVMVHSTTARAVAERTAATAAEAAARVGLGLAARRLRDEVAHYEATRDADQFRHEVLAAASHDMRTPLSVLLGLVDVLGEVVPDTHADTFDAMARQVRRLRRLVKKFLDYSRLEEGRPLAVRPVTTDVEPIIAEVAADMAAGRTVEIRRPRRLPPALVDPEALDQVLANLVSNALKFSDPDEPVIIEADANRDFVEISVIDSGRGMSPGELANAFTKYYRGHNAVDRPGTGLGLYVSQALVAAFGGRIVPASRRGQGSRFTVVVPRASGVAGLRRTGSRPRTTR